MHTEVIVRSQHLNEKSEQGRTLQRPKLVIPFITTRLIADIRLYFGLQPLFWLMGLEQIIPAVIVLWLIVKRTLISTTMRIPRPIWLALVFWVWQLLHVFSLPSGELDLFIKAQGTWLALVGLFILIYNLADTPARWKYIVNGIELFAVVVLVMGMLYILGVADVQIPSLLGEVLPSGLIAKSHFFSTISTRGLGYFEQAIGFRRVRSTFWHPSSYASVLLVFWAVEWFQFKRKGATWRGFRLVVLLLILINLIYTFSRTTYVSFAVMVFIIWWLGGQTRWSRLQKLITLSVFGAGILIYLLFIFSFQGRLSFDLVNDVVYDFRPNSVLARFRIYETSWLLIKEKPFWGWGTLVKIEGLPSQFSAGSHSDYLSMLFQFGIPGLLLYLLFIGATGYALLKGYMTSKLSETRSYLAIMLALMAAMLVRQITSEVSWDIYVLSTLWSVWALGLALIANECAISRAMKRTHLQGP